MIIGRTASIAGMDITTIIITTISSDYVKISKYMNFSICGAVIVAVIVMMLSLLLMLSAIVVV